MMMAEKQEKTGVGPEWKVVFIAAVVAVGAAALMSFTLGKHASGDVASAACNRAVAGLNMWLSHASEEHDAAEKLRKIPRSTFTSGGQVAVDIVQSTWESMGTTDGVLTVQLRQQVVDECPGVVVPTPPAFLLTTPKPVPGETATAPPGRRAGTP